MLARIWNQVRYTELPRPVAPTQRHSGSCTTSFADCLRCQRVTHSPSGQLHSQRQPACIAPEMWNPKSLQSRAWRHSYAWEVDQRCSTHCLSRLPLPRGGDSRQRTTPWYLAKFPESCSPGTGFIQQRASRRLGTRRTSMQSAIDGYASAEESHRCAF